MRNTPTSSDDIIDSRDVIERIEELEADRESAAEDDNEKTWDADNGEELKALKALAEQAEGYAPDWSHGTILIRDDYFEKYAQQFAEEIGAMPVDASWPCNCIDWEQAANELQVDYTAVDFNGTTYWVR